MKKTRALSKDDTGKYPLFIMEGRMLQITALQTIVSIFLAAPALL